MSSPLPTSVFAAIHDRVFAHRYAVTIHVHDLVGGVPTDKNVAEGWIRTKMGETSDEIIRDEVERVMEARGVTPEIAAEEVARNRHLTGFERNFGTPMALADQQKAMTTGFVFEGKRKIFTEQEARRTFGQLLVRGRQVKAMLKEAAMISGSAGHIPMTRWGKTNKALKGFFAEHLFVVEDEILMDRTGPDSIEQSFVHTWRGAGIKLEEHVRDVELTFTVVSDHPFEDEDPEFYGKVFVAGEMNGLGASRSQGYGRFSVIKFEAVGSAAKPKPPTRKVAPKAKAELDADA